MKYEKTNILNMEGYIPGEQPIDQSVVKLNTNENPYPASDAVARALSKITVEDLRRYPAPIANKFRQVAADYHGVEIDNIIPTNGGDEFLRLTIATFVDQHQTLGIAEPGYSLYPVLAQAQGCQVTRVALQQDWNLDVDFASRLNDANANLMFIVNPHAPSGILTPVDRLAEIANEFCGVVVIDEAYVDFIEPGLAYNSVPLINEFDNVLILRTMSKGYSLAGLRFGYGIGPISLLEPMLYKTRDSYNTDTISQLLATAALLAVDDAAITWKNVIADRTKLKRKLAEMGLSCPDSQSNFLLATVPTDNDAANIYQCLKDQNILVRYFDLPHLQDKLRLSIGTPEQNQQLLDALGRILHKNH